MEVKIGTFRWYNCGVNLPAKDKDEQCAQIPGIENSAIPKVGLGDGLGQVEVIAGNYQRGMGVPPVLFAHSFCIECKTTSW